VCRIKGVIAYGFETVAEPNVFELVATRKRIFFYGFYAVGEYNGFQTVVKIESAFAYFRYAVGNNDLRTALAVHVVSRVRGVVGKGFVPDDRNGAVIGYHAVFTAA
jgi:hypothetical protein